jgi:hypothetical protein
MRGRRKKGMHLRTAMCVTLLAVVAVISGCAEFQEGFGRFFGNLSSGRQTGPRDEAVRAYHYSGLKDEVILETPKLTPRVVSAGDRLTQVSAFVVLAPRKETTFKVLEIVTLSGGDILMELSRRDSEKPQGRHTSTVQFVIPKDLPRGNYTLTTTIIANGTEKKQIASFVAQGG